MTPDQLRALADALDGCTPYRDSASVYQAAAYLRACADAKPVGWRVECRWLDRSKGGDWRKYADYGTEAAARSSQQVFANPGDIESRIVPLYAHPAPQPLPERQPGSEPTEAQSTIAERRLRHALDGLDHGIVANDVREVLDELAVLRAALAAKEQPE